MGTSNTTVNLTVPAMPEGPILLTGATGFLGANIARHFLASKESVHTLIRATSPRWRLRGLDDLQMHETELTDADAVLAALREIRPRVILHFAAHPALADERDDAAIFSNTVLPIVHLVRAAAEIGTVEAFVNAGSSSEYGYQSVPMREDMLPSPTSTHGVAKYAQTLYGQYAARQFNLPLITLRLFSIYGPFEQPRRLIPRLMRAALKNILVQLSNPQTARDFTYVDDVISAVTECLKNPRQYAGAVYNVGTGRQTTLAGLIEQVEHIHGKPIPVQWGQKPPNKWDAPTWVADPTLAETQLGFRTHVSLADGLGLTYQWFTQHLNDYPEYFE